MTAIVETDILRRPSAGPLSRSAGWWGTVLLIATEATLFLLLLASYFYLRVENQGSWPPSPHTDPKILRPLLATLILILASLAMIVATRSARSGRRSGTRAGLAAAFVLGSAFLVFQGILVHDSLAEFSPRDDAYSSIYYTLIGVHYVHVAAGLLGVAWALLRVSRFTPERHLTLQVTALYWHFVNAVAVIVFLALSISPQV